MSSDADRPLLATEDSEPTDMKTKAKKVARGCAIVSCGCLLVLFVLAWIVQGFMYWYATLGCSPKHFVDYSFPGGGTSNLGGPSFNLVPEISLLTQNAPGWFGSSFSVIPSNAASTTAGAPVGYWWRTGGPIFTTYTYEDVANSRVTLYMRQNLLRIGMSHRIGRCDGKGEQITITEGSNWFMNRIRKIFRFNQAMSYKIYVGDKWVAVAEETSQGFSSVTFRNETSGEVVGSAILASRHFHGQYDQWLVKDVPDKAVFPYYVSSAASLLFAYNMVNSAPPSSTGSGPTFLSSSSLNTTTATAEVIANRGTTAGQSKAEVKPAVESVKLAEQKVHESNQAKVEIKLPIQSPKDPVQAVQLDQANPIADLPMEETKRATSRAKDGEQTLHIGSDQVKHNVMQNRLPSTQQKSKEQHV